MVMRTELAIQARAAAAVTQVGQAQTQTRPWYLLPVALTLQATGMIHNSSTQSSQAPKHRHALFICHHLCQCASFSFTDEGIANIAYVVFHVFHMHLQP